MKSSILILIIVTLILLSKSSYAQVSEQWASSAVASSEYPGYEAIYATGPEDTSCGVDALGAAWARSDAEYNSGNTSWIELTFDTAVNAIGVYAHVTYDPNVTKVELKDIDGNWHTIWSGESTECVFNITFTQTTYKTKVVRITIGAYKWSEIDAVKLYGAPPPPPPPTVIILPVLTDFSATPAIIKRSQTTIFNLTIIDDTGVDPNSIVSDVRSPIGERFGTATRFKLISGDYKEGVYQTNWTAPRDAISGVYSLYVSVCDIDGNCLEDYVNVGNFTVNGSLIFDVVPSKNVYELGEEITLTGFLKDALDFKVKNNPFTLTLSLGDFKKTIMGETDSTGEITIGYRISFTDPTGDWILTLNTVDEDGNEGTYTTSVKVTTPPGMVYYNVVFLSPTAGTTYYRGETVRVSIELREVDRPVGYANVTLKLPTGERLKMQELSPGLGRYRAEYKLGWGDMSGEWTISVEGIKQTAEGLFSGARDISINVRAVELSIKILSPTDNRFAVNERIKIKVKVTYPDGSPATNIAVNATPVAKSIVLTQTEPGIYEGEYRFSSEELGRWSLRIYGTDPYQNIGYTEQVIFITQPTVLDYLIQFWYLTAIAIVSVIYGIARMILLPKIKASKYLVVLEKELKECQRELKRLQKLRKDAQTKKRISELKARIEQLKREREKELRRRF